MDRWVGKVAVVTGASAGIGASIAEKLVEAGVLVVGLARRSQRIEELAKKLSEKPGKLFAFQTDMSKESDIVSAFKWTTKNVGPVHILINNAGIVQQTNLIEGDTKKWKQVLDVNVMGLCIATREAVTIMRENKIDGHIVHINSVLGHRVLNFQDLNLYPATKYAVTALAETLRLELHRFGTRIKITSVSPGFVQTELLDAAGYQLEPEVMEKFLQREALQAQDVADAVMYTLSTPPRVQVHEITLQPFGEAT